MLVTSPIRSCDSQNNIYIAAAAGGTVIAWAYINPHSALGYLSTVVSGVAASQLVVRGLGCATKNIRSLYSRFFPETFVDPKLVKDGSIHDRDGKGGLTIAFIEIEREGGRTELVPVQRRFTVGEPRNNQVYTRFPGTFEEALMMIAEQEDDNCFRLFESVLTDSSNMSGLTMERFCSFLCTPQNGVMPIYNINRISLEETLTLIQERAIKVDLSLVNPKTGKTLLQKCLSEVNHLDSAQKLLEIDPESGARFFEDVIQSGSKELVNTIVSFIEQREIKLSFEAKWLMRAFQGDCSFSDENYLALTTTLQDEIFQVANTYNCYELVRRLRKFHPEEGPIACRGPGIISVNMDAVQIRNRVLAFFQQKRKEGLLYTEHEFRHIDKSQYFGRPKNNNIGRILGRDFIERVAEELGAPCVKVPRKTMVVSKYCYCPEDGSNPDPFEISVYKRSLLKDPGMSVPYGVVTVWAELITQVNKHVTRVQMSDLIKVLEATGFDDFKGINIMYGRNQSGEEAFYFIDTEFENFRQVPLFFHNIQQCLPAFMSKADHPWLQEQMTVFCERVAYRRTEDDVRKLSSEENASSEKYGFSSRHSSFQFEPNELFPGMI